MPDWPTTPKLTQVLLMFLASVPRRYRQFVGLFFVFVGVIVERFRSVFE
jgi:hypothetical protein